MPKVTRRRLSSNRGGPRPRPGISRSKPARKGQQSSELVGVDRRFVQQGAREITDTDIKKVSDNADAIRKKFARGGPIGRFIEDASA